MNKNYISTRFLIIPLFVICVGLSLWFSILKFDALDYHTRDFAFFAQTQARLLDQNLSPQLSLNPDGHNFLGFRGTECEKSLHQGIHLAPIKYIHALLYFVSGNLSLVFLLNSLIVFSPALYLCYFYRNEEKVDQLFCLIISACYLTYPSIQHFASYDLRHYIFLTPFFILAILSIYLDRSFLEKIFFFNLLFFAREEALILGCVVIFYAIATSKKSNIETLYRSPVVWYFLSYAFWFTTTIIYFSWTDYRQEIPFIERIILPVIFLSSGSVAILFLRKHFDKILPHKSFDLIGFIAILTCFVPLVYHGGVWRQIDFYSILFFNRYFLYIGCGFITTLAIWRVFRKKLPRIIILCCLFGAFAFFMYANSPFMNMPDYVSKRERPFTVKIQTYLSLKKNAQIVHKISNILDYRSNIVLTDYKTHQAFYNFENVYVYQRLPWYTLPGRERYYPENRTVLQELLRSRIEYIVISKNSYKDLKKEIRAVGIEKQVKLVDQNKSFMILKLVRH